MASNSSFDLKTGGLEVARTYSAQASGRTVLVTGVSVDTLGDAIVRSFAEGGASVIIITGRSDERLAEVIKALSSDYPSTKFRPLKFDLASLKSVHAAAQELLDDTTIPQIDILVACGGLHDFKDERTLTVDGLELHLGVNHMSHHHFITQLLPKLRASAKKSAPGTTRVIMIASQVWACSPFRFSDYNFDGNPLAADEKGHFELLTAAFGTQPTDGYDHTIAYAQSKTANALFAVHANEIWASENISAFALHPGIVGTQSAAPLFDSLPKETVAKFGFMKTIDQGAATALVAALDPGLKPEGGVTLEDCQITSVPEWVTDKEKAAKLWALSEELISSKLAA
ncbi:retinol dehydrogenase 12 [Massariosphaeria phaeospora]|uniref:Retinol dehydrogenase 12 n=1 Tax=Massariosphaeria phaeospora TaxID=100035 RepID=A0A7C8M5A3_9PLEO|nr:retinol dehydrogenase 12 [Massariosphaeria phaeospora]